VEKFLTLGKTDTAPFVCAVVIAIGARCFCCASKQNRIVDKPENTDVIWVFDEVKNPLYQARRSALRCCA
jgi:hypothetical protein